MCQVLPQGGSQDLKDSEAPFQQGNIVPLLASFYPFSSEYLTLGEL